MFRNRPLGAKKMLSGAFKVTKHIKTIPKPKGLHSNIVKIILGNFLEKSFFGGQVWGGGQDCEITGMCGFIEDRL